MPKRYIAVERFSAVLLTWKVWLAFVLAMDSAAPAHAWTKIRSERMAMFLARDFSGHCVVSCQLQNEADNVERSHTFLGSNGSSSPDSRTYMWSSCGPGRSDSFPTSGLDGGFSPFSTEGEVLLSLRICWPILLYWW
jgi:hypothetical protein